MADSAKGIHYLNSIQNTKHSVRRVMESRLPLRKGLEAIHHATIVTAGRGCDQAGKSRVRLDCYCKNINGMHKREIQVLSRMSLLSKVVNNRMG